MYAIWALFGLRVSCLSKTLFSSSVSFVVRLGIFRRRTQILSITSQINKPSHFNKQAQPIAEKSMEIIRNRLNPIYNVDIFVWLLILSLCCFCPALNLPKNSSTSLKSSVSTKCRIVGYIVIEHLYDTIQIYFRLHMCGTATTTQATFVMCIGFTSC